MVSPFTHLSYYWTAFSGHEYKEKYTQSNPGPHLVVVLNAVEHTKSFIGTGVSLVPGPCRFVAKLSVEYRIRHRISFRAIQTFGL